MANIVDTDALASFDMLLGELPAAGVVARAPLIQRLLAVAGHLLQTDAGLAALAERAPRFESSGLFQHTAWADPGRLIPALVKPGLLAPGATGVTEAMSELRVLAIAQGTAETERMSREEAHGFLETVLALSLDLLVPASTEAARLEGSDRRRAERVCAYLAEALSLTNLLGVVTVEVEQVLAQRQIIVDRALELLSLAARVPLQEGEARPARLERYLQAINGPGPLSARHADPDPYRAALVAAEQEAQHAEAQALGETLRATGLVCRQHAVLLLELRQDRRALELALRLNAGGRAELEQHHPFVMRLLQEAVHPQTAGCIYGLASLLERGLLSRPEVKAGLRRLFALELAPGTLARIAERFGQDAPAKAHLVAGAVSVLGQPLGLGQGHNPTCQAARGLSLWAQLAPGHLLAQLAAAARAERLEVLFEGVLLRSDTLLAHGLVQQLDPSLDVVSLLLVPHLDRIYDAMMHRVAGRPGDGHRWVNPALYGPWVGPHMAAAFELPFREFVRRFYASHHPAYSGQYQMIHPTPVGLFVTNAHGVLLGRHAVTLQRVQVDPQGTVRAYFFNPNNDSRQDWGQGIVVDVAGHGEQEGESSLPVDQLASRLYAFHYTLYEDAWGAAVPEAEVVAVERLARESWGRAYPGGEARFG